MVGTSGGKAHPAAEWLHGNGTLMWRRVYPGRADLIAQVRAWLALQFADTDRVDDVVAIASELVSNALLYTRSGESGGWFGVEVSRGDDLRIAVRDLGGGAAPRIGRATLTIGDALAEHGYGLRLVEGLGSAVGVDGSPAEGHTVWVVLPLDSSRMPQGA